MTSNDLSDEDLVNTTFFWFNTVDAPGCVIMMKKTNLGDEGWIGISGVCHNGVKDFKNRKCCI